MCSASCRSGICSKRVPLTSPLLDVMRTGGISGWLKLAAMAEAFNLPVVSYLYPEIPVHLVAGVPNFAYCWFQLSTAVCPPSTAELPAAGGNKHLRSRFGLR